MFRLYREILETLRLDLITMNGTKDVAVLRRARNLFCNVDRMRIKCREIPRGQPPAENTFALLYVVCCSFEGHYIATMLPGNPGWLYISRQQMH